MQIQKCVSPKIKVRLAHHKVALTFGVLVVSFLAAFYVVAWQEPGQTPPQGNVPAPINVGSTAQTKEGNLTINGVLKTLGNMIVNLVTIKGDGSMSPNLNSDKLDDYHAADLMAQGASKNLYTTKCSWGCGGFSLFDPNAPYSFSGIFRCTSSCAPPNCDSGDTSLVTGGCAAMGGGVSFISPGVAREAVWNGYGYCERVCRDE